MPKSKAVVPSTFDPHSYTDDRLGMPETAMDAMLDGMVESRFVDNACLEDGGAGKTAIHTPYENTSVTDMQVVRSDLTRYEDRPAPRDTKRYDYPHRGY